MKLQDLDYKSQTEKSQKVFESYFHEPVKFDRLNKQKAVDMLERVRGMINETRHSSKFFSSENDPAYLKLMVMEQALSSRIEEADLPIDMKAPQVKTAMQKAERGQNLTPDEQKIISAVATSKTESKKKKHSSMEKMLQDARLNESEVQQAQVVLAAQDITDRIQDMLEEATEMQFKDIPALVESIRNEVGTSEAQSYADQTDSALGALVEALQLAKTSIESAQGILTGQEPIVPGEEEMDLGMDTDTDTDVEVDVEEPEEEPESDLEASLGRARR